MLPKSHRLPTRDASLVRRRGKRISTPELAIQYVLSSQPSVPRFFIQVPAKRIKTAIERHRIKRVLTEALRLHFLERVFPGAHIITVLESLSAITTPKMKELLENLFKKAALLS